MKQRTVWQPLVAERKHHDRIAEVRELARLQIISSPPSACG